MGAAPSRLQFSVALRDGASLRLTFAPKGTLVIFR